MSRDDDLHRLINKMADERDRLITRLGGNDAVLWRSRDLLKEWVAIHQENSPWNADLIGRQDRLLAETRAFLDGTPEVVQLPTLTTSSPAGDAAGPSGPPLGDAGRAGTDGGDAA